MNGKSAKYMSDDNCVKVNLLEIMNTEIVLYELNYIDFIIYCML